MKLASFIHPHRTYLPCSGVGRHINNLLSNLHNTGIDHRLVYCRQWLGKDGFLPKNAPLRDIPFYTLPFNERLLERSWKALNWPKMDSYFADAEWVFSPAETLVPLKHKRFAVTLHDIQPYETDLPWSDTAAHKKIRKRWEWWLPKLVAQADIVFTVSEFSRQRLLSLTDLVEAKVKISGNAIDPVFLEKKDQVSAHKLEQPYLLVMGGLRRKKGGEEIIRLAGRLKVEFPGLNLVTFGENDWDLLKLAAKLENIIVLPMISDEEMIAYLKGAEAALFLSWYEGFGLPVLEAMACDVPVICSDQASLPEIAGDAAIMLRPDDTHAILESIHHLKDSMDFRQYLIRKGNQNISRFSWKKCAENVVNALEQYDA